MFREVGKIYVRAFRMMFQYPLFIYLPATYHVYSLVYYISKNYMPLGLATILGLIDLFIDAIFIFGVSIVFILIVLQMDDASDLRKVMGEARAFFWKYIGQSFVAAFLALVFSIPFSCVILLLYSLSEKTVIPFMLWLWTMNFLAMGSFSLGSRFLIDGGKGLFKNSMDGLRMLNGYFSFFITLYGILLFISALNIALRLFIGSLFTGLDLSSLSFSSMSALTKSMAAISETPAVYVVDMVAGTFLFSFYNIVTTLAYIRCKNHASLSRAVQQSQLTEN